MPLSNLSSLSLACRSSVGRRQLAFSGVFTIPEHASSFHAPPPPPTASVAPRHIHSFQPDQRHRPKITREALFGAQKLKTAQSAGVALTMAKALFQDKAKNSNVVFSPLLIHVLLSLVAAGSSGPTRDQLLSFLKSDSIDELNHSASQITSIVLGHSSHRRGPRLSFANGVWVDQSLSLKDSFKQILDTTYKATLHQCDFKTKADEVVSDVNSWVDTHTKGLITNILSPSSIDSSTNLILANALYFKGAWENTFDRSNTRKDKFYLQDGSSVEVPFMTSSKKQYIAVYDEFKVLKMPYEQGSDARRFSMYIFLPDDKDGLPSLIDKMDSQPGFINRHIPNKRVSVDKFMVPKFKFSFGVDFSEVLKRLGLVLPFVGGGDLSEMVDSSRIEPYAFVSNIFHKSFIEVNEKGTEAAAASCMLLGCGRIIKSDRIDFVADHPFLFAIREDVTKTLPFVGQVHSPI